MERQMKDDGRSGDHISVLHDMLVPVSVAQGALTKGSLRDQRCPRRRRLTTSLKNQSGLCPGEALLKADKWTSPVWSGFYLRVMEQWYHGPWSMPFLVLPCDHLREETPRISAASHALHLEDDIRV
jgi:hypothetical protein